LADGLRENQSLRSLQLNGNPVGDTGVMIIIEAVGVNCAVRDLGLQDCQTVKGGAGLFDPLNPTGTYTLNLAHEYDRSIFTKLKARSQPPMPPPSHRRHRRLAFLYLLLFCDFLNYRMHANGSYNKKNSYLA